MLRHDTLCNSFALHTGPAGPLSTTKEYNAHHP